jgi:hypothetical protein
MRYVPSCILLVRCPESIIMIAEIPAHTPARGRRESASAQERLSRKLFVTDNPSPCSIVILNGAKRSEESSFLN